MYDLLLQEMYNFVTHKKTIIDFSKIESVHIWGENRDNKSMIHNGIGKSLIMDAVCWCLTGKMIRLGGQADSVIGQFMKYCCVKQVWKNEDRYIKIVRYRKHLKHRNRVFVYFSDDGKTWSKDRSKETVGDTDTYIQKLFRIDHNLFVAGVALTKPHQSLDFCESKDTRRKDVLTNLLNLDWIDKAKDKAKKDLDRNLIDLRLLEEQRESSEERFEVLINESNDLEKRINNFEADKLKQINDKISQIRNLKKNKKSYNNVIQKLEKKKNIGLKKHTVLEKLNDGSVELRTKMEHKFEAIGKLENERKVLERKLVKHENTDFIEGDICNECGSEYHKKNIHILMHKVESEIKKCEGEIKYQNDLCQKIISETEVITEKIKRYSKYSMKNIRVIEEKINSYKEKEVDQKSNEKEIVRLRKEINDIKNSKNQFSSLHTEKVTQMMRVNEKLNKINSKIKNINIKVKYNKVAMEAYGNSGIKNDIISSKIQLLEEMMNYYLTKITNGDIFIKLDNKVKHGQSERIGIMIQDGSKKKPLDYLLWSGGQQCRIKFAVEWAINSIMESPINLLFIDEGFDKLDSSGIKIILDLMREEKKRVVCVSNLPSMRNVFNDSIKVVLENGISRVEA